MFRVWILLSSLLLGVRAFMIYNTKSSLCLEDSATGEVLLKKCNIDSASQQWTWIDQGMLMCVASSNCLLAVQRKPLQAQPCRSSEVDAVQFAWDCDRDRLISKNTSMLLSVDGQHLILAHDSKHSKWRSLDVGDICQEKLRFKRASNDLEEYEAAEEKTGEVLSMTEEQREYLQWFYRTEDSTTWKFVLLGLAFVCLLVGFLLLGMGAMASKNRKEIAKYKAAATLAQKSEDEELQLFRDNCSNKQSPSLDFQLQGNKSSPSNGELSELKAGNIMVMWKDGKTSCLYSDHAVEEEKQEEKQEEAELEADQAVKMME
ncbi:uncharacterized protein AB9X84_007720 isoform 1-T1 [Acanthopagrus schlegelii]